MNRPIKNILILTGAGISAGSGIATFRDSDGLWENHRLEEVATPEAFERNPELVQKFYNARRAQLLDPNIQPNSAHYALTKLQQKHQGHVTIVTQNVDNLHSRAGSENIIAMHGELLKVRCVHSGKVYQWEKAITDADGCCCCQPMQPLRPHIVWFGEIPLHMNKIYQRLSSADFFIAIGTSGNVYPAAGFIAKANAENIPTLEINLKPSHNQSAFDHVIYGCAEDVVPQWVDDFLIKH